MDLLILLAIAGLVWLLSKFDDATGNKRAEIPEGLRKTHPMTGDSTGRRYGLTAVEAAVLLERPMDRVLTMILFGVLKKGAARILSPKPLKLEITSPFPQGLHDYEIDFLKIFLWDQAPEALDRDLKSTMVKLVKAVSNKMRGFSRAETAIYYRRFVEDAWRQVKAAATPEVKGRKFDEVMDWALLDDDFAGRSVEALGAGPLPVPGWWERFRPLIQTATSLGDSPTLSAAPDWPAGAWPALPGADFAASLANGIQDFSAAAVGDVQHFTSEIADLTNDLISAGDGGHDGGYDGGHDGWGDGGHDGWADGGHDGGFDGGFDGGDSDGDGGD